MGTSKSDSGHTPPTPQPTPPTPPVLKPLALFEDEPIRSNTEDHLTLRPFADIVAGAAIGTRGPFTIGVFAEWGQGKTSVLQLARDRLDSSSDSDNIVTVFFNAWQFERESHPIVPLMATIVKEIENKEAKLAREGKVEVLQRLYQETTSAFASFKSALKMLIRSTTVKAKVELPLVGGVEVEVSGKEAIGSGPSSAQSSGPPAESMFYYERYNALEKLVETARTATAGGKGSPAEAAAGPRIVVFIDDLDRCLPDKAVQLLESIKLVLSQPGFIFVLAVARHVIDGHLQKRYEEFGVEDAKIQGRRYLQKIVQLPLPIPAHPNKRFAHYIKERIQSHTTLEPAIRNVLTQLEPLITIGTQRSPRTVVRLLNNLLVDDRLRVTVYHDQDGGGGIDRETFVGLCCVARCLREELGDRMYERLSRSSQLCTALLHESGISQLDNLEFMDEAAIEQRRQQGKGRPVSDPASRESTTELRDPGGKLRELVRYLQAATHLDELFRHPHGKMWLRKPEFRTIIDEFFAEQRDETPSSEQALSQAAIVERAIREALNMDEGAPIPPERLREIKELDLSQDKIGDTGLVHLKGMTNLSTLSLSNTQVSDKGLEHLKGMTNLSTLSLSNTQVSDKGLEHLKGMTNLSTLGLNGTQVSDDGLEHLKGMTNLSTLWLNGTQVSDDGLEHLKGMTKLSSLDLGATKVSGDGLEHLKGMTNLTELSLSGTQVSNDGLEHLKGMTNLSTLWLHHTQVNDHGLEHLKGMKKLNELYLSQTKVGNDGLEHLKGMTNLITLGLSGTQVSDKGLEHLKGMTKLSTLWLNGTQVTTAGVAALKQALPKLRVHGVF